MKKIMDLEKTEERLLTFTVDVLDYHSILEALKGCCALVCCLDNADIYDVSSFYFLLCTSTLPIKYIMPVCLQMFVFIG